MSEKLQTIKRTLADGTVKEYSYERKPRPKEPPKPKKPRTRPVSKRALTDIIKTFNVDQIAMLIEYAKELSAKTDNEKNTPENIPETLDNTEKSDEKSSQTSEDQ